jgi:hypothetical protein
MLLSTSLSAIEEMWTYSIPNMGLGSLRINHIYGGVDGSAFVTVGYSAGRIDEGHWINSSGILINTITPNGANLTTDNFRAIRISNNELIMVNYTNLMKYNADNTEDYYLLQSEINSKFVTSPNYFITKDSDHLIRMRRFANDSSSGLAGPAGPAGAQGPAGPTGAQGPAGADGEQGPAGPAGADGEQGPAGPAGPTGAQGLAGADGADGEQGPAGPQGIQGETSSPDTSVSTIPSNAVVIPSDSSGPVQIILESSEDLVNWNSSNPGTYGASTNERFFRIRAVQNTE